MTRRPRRNHSPAFKAEVVREAVKLAFEIPIVGFRVRSFEVLAYLLDCDSPMVISQVTGDSRLSGCQRSFQGNNHHCLS